jgi:hypothetical protein
MTRNTNGVFYARLYARNVGREMQVQIRNREDAVLSEAITPHQAASVQLLCGGTNYINIYGFNADVQNFYNTDINVQNAVGNSVNSTKSIYVENVEITPIISYDYDNNGNTKYNYGSDEWVLLGEFYYGEANNNNLQPGDVFSLPIISMISFPV